MINNLKDTIPPPAERARLNRRLATHHEPTGWSGDDGHPAPWPDDIDTWPDLLIDAEAKTAHYDADGNPRF